MNIDRISLRGGEKLLPKFLHRDAVRAFQSFCNDDCYITRDNKQLGYVLHYCTYCSMRILCFIDSILRNSTCLSNFHDRKEF